MPQHRPPLLLIPNPGFDSNPGQGAYSTDMALARRVQALKSSDLRQQVWAALNGSAKRKTNYNFRKAGQMDALIKACRITAKKQITC